MMIQERISEALTSALQGKGGDIQNLKVLKAELQRGKTKELSDLEVNTILVQRIRSQEEMIRDVTTRNRAFIDVAKSFLDEDALQQVSMTHEDLKEWILKNIDFTAIKGKMAAIGIVKKSLPYVDGNMVKDILLSL